MRDFENKKLIGSGNIGTVVSLYGKKINGFYLKVLGVSNKDYVEKL